MSLGERIEGAVKPIVAICVPKQYGGDAMEYCTYNYTETPDFFGDDEPGAVRCQVQVHWLFPWAPGISETAEVLAKKKQLCRALAGVLDVWPTITDASDSEWMHYVFEAQTIEEV